MVISALLGLTNPKCEGLLYYYILPTISLQDVPKVSLKSIGSWRIIKYLSFHEIVKEEKAWGSVRTQAYVFECVRRNGIWLPHCKTISPPFRGNGSL